MLRRFGFAVAAALVMLATATPASAQDEKKVQLTLGGGYTGVYGPAKDRIGNSGNLTFGLLFNVSPVLSVQGEYAWNGMQKKNIQIPVSVSPTGSSVPTDFFVDGNMQYGDVNLLLHPPMSGRAAPYFITGLGIYYRPISITTPGVGFATVCDPYWYVCYPAAVPVDQIVGSRSSTDFGMNFGGGVNVRMGETSSLFFEVRYHYVWGPTVTVPSGGTASNTTKANGQFLPITVGFRF